MAKQSTVLYSPFSIYYPWTIPRIRLCSAPRWTAKSHTQSLVGILCKGFPVILSEEFSHVPGFTHGICIDFGGVVGDLGTDKPFLVSRRIDQ